MVAIFHKLMEDSEEKNDREIYYWNRKLLKLSLIMPRNIWIIWTFHFSMFDKWIGLCLVTWLFSKKCRKGDILLPGWPSGMHLKKDWRDWGEGGGKGRGRGRHFAPAIGGEGIFVKEFQQRNYQIMWKKWVRTWLFGESYSSIPNVVKSKDEMKG